MFDYPALHALASVIREGSFERAARALHVTPSAVSQRVRLLEERVGCALVVRDQPCRATETGRRLCQHWDQVQLLEYALRDTLPSLAAPGPLRVRLPMAVNADSLDTWAAQAIAQFAAAHPVLMDVTVDDQDHTAQWLRSGTVLAAVTAHAQPVVGCNSQPLGAMRYVAAASPAFVARYFAQGVTAQQLTHAPSLVFSTKDALQARWAERVCGQSVVLTPHTLPSPQAFVTAALHGMGWGLHPHSLVAPLLAQGLLVELVPAAPLDVALYWQHTRAAQGLLGALSAAIASAAQAVLIALPAQPTL